MLFAEARSIHLLKFHDQEHEGEGDEGLGGLRDRDGLEGHVDGDLVFHRDEKVLSVP